MPRESKPHLHNGYFRCRIDGDEIHLGKDKRQAWVKFHRLMGEKLADAIANDGRPGTVAGVIAGWFKLHDKPGDHDRLAHFRDFAGRMFLADVSKDLLTRFYIHLRHEKAKAIGRPLAPGTIRLYMLAAAAVLRWAVEQEWLDRMPTVPELAAGLRRARDMEPERIMAGLDDMTGTAACAAQPLRFIAFTGCRPSEACRLRWEDVHLERGIAILSIHKTAAATGKPRSIYLTPEADTLLRQMLAERTRLSVGPVTGPVFRNRAGQPYTSAGLRSVMKNHFGGATPYQLRHSYAQRAAEADTTIDDLAKLMGHANPQTTRRYFETRDGRAIAAAKRLSIGTAAG